MRRAISSTPVWARIIPRGLVVGLRLGIEPGENAVRIARQLKAGFDDECRVREVDQVIFGYAVVLDGIVNDAAEERDVRPRPNLTVEIRHGSRPGEPRIDDNHFRVA